VSMRLINPFIAGSTPALGFEPETIVYVAAVAVADGQPLEAEVRTAIDNFVAGCKADGIWTAIKSCCILAGARTLAGALIPLVGAAPTNVNGSFLAGDYNRETGLIGDGSTKHLNSNRANNADPQDSNHNAVWASSPGTYDGTPRTYMGSFGDPSASGGNVLIQSTIAGLAARSRASTLGGTNVPPVAGLIGVNRSSPSQFVVRNGGANATFSVASQTPDAVTVTIFRRNQATASPTNARIAFYSIGEGLNLALLDTRVSALITAIGAAIP